MLLGYAWQQKCGKTATGQPTRVNDKNRNQSATVRRAHAARTLRIIGGRHRGRRLRFPPLESIRPTPDRVRETLFNWLQGHLDGSRCLDLFAGSGVLGLEALSRGAARWITGRMTRRPG